jgi:hypothetical protein
MTTGFPATVVAAFVFPALINFSLARKKSYQNGLSDREIFNKDFPGYSLNLVSHFVHRLQCADSTIFISNRIYSVDGSEI